MLLADGGVSHTYLKDLQEDYYYTLDNLGQDRHNTTAFLRSMGKDGLLQKIERYGMNDRRVQDELRGLRRREIGHMTRNDQEDGDLDPPQGEGCFLPLWNEDGCLREYSSNLIWSDTAHDQTSFGSRRHFWTCAVLIRPHVWIKRECLSCIHMRYHRFNNNNKNNNNNNNNDDDRNDNSSNDDKDAKSEAYVYNRNNSSINDDDDNYNKSSIE